MKTKEVNNIRVFIVIFFIASFLLLSGFGSSSIDNSNRIVTQTNIFYPLITRDNSFYIYDLLDSRRPIKTINSKITFSEFDTNNVRFINKRLYLFNESKNLLGWLDNSGKFNELPFTKVDAQAYFDFIFSPDGRKIAWIDNKRTSSGKSINTINISNIDGTGRKRVYNRTLSNEDHLSFLQWGKTGKIYFGKQFGGLGGLSVQEKLEDLYALDMATGKASFLFGKDRKYDNSEFIAGLSNAGDQMAYFWKSKTRFDLIIRNLKTGKESVTPFPNKELLSVGSLIFSPDSKYLVFDVDTIKSTSNIEGLYYRHYLLDIANKKLRALEQTSYPYLDYAWISNHMLVLYGKRVKIVDVNSLK